jgi:rod shape-determining protein MreC
VAFRDSPFQGLKAPLTWAAAAVAIVVAVVALGLLLTDRRTAAHAGPYGAARGEFDEVMEPVTNLLSAPAHWFTDFGGSAGAYVFAIHQNEALKKQVQELERWRDAAIALKNLNLRYESLLKLRTEPPIPMVTARVVSDARGPFSDARLADAGSADGVKIGNPAMSEDGVVGRVVGVTKNASRILLLTDVESRTPVLIDRSNARAILTGDGGPNPKLDFVRGFNSVKEGDIVLTSGDGGLYPRGLPVGMAARDYRGVWRVRLYSDRAAIDFVRILVFDDFSQTVSQAELADSTLPPLTPEEQAQLQAAKVAAMKPAAVPAVGPQGAQGQPSAPQTSQPSTAPPTQLPRAQVPSGKPAVKTAKSSAAKSKPKIQPKIPKGAFRPDEVIVPTPPASPDAQPQ